MTVETKSVHHFVYDEATKESDLDQMRAEATKLNMILERHNHTVEL